MSDSVRPQRQQPTRFPRPWDSPGKNTGVGRHFLLQCMKVKSESEVAQSCPTLSDPMDCSPPGSSVHGIFQARVLEWGAVAFSNLCNDAPINTQKDRVQQTSRLVNQNTSPCHHVQSKLQDDRSAFLWDLPCVSLHLAADPLISFVMNF